MKRTPKNQVIFKTVDGKVYYLPSDYNKIIKNKVLVKIFNLK